MISVSLNGEIVARLWLECAGYSIVYAFLDAVMNIKELSASGTKQLIADMDYMCNVAEDLGLVLPEGLTQMKELLAVDAKEFKPRSRSYPSKIASVVANLRRLKL